MSDEPQLRDAHGRVVDYLRLSVTDRCNLRCRYCMPAEGLPLAPRDEVLSFEEIARAVGVGASLGVRRVRVTGGEPLLRREVATLVAMLKAVPGVEEVSMTTNGLLLHRFAGDLVDAGLDRVNISLDSLRPDRFERLTRAAMLDETWRGIEAASDAGMGPIKINTVVVAGFNEDEIDDWVALTRQRDLIVRFLEVMPIGEGLSMRRLGGFHDLTATRERLQRDYGIEPVASSTGSGPARYWRVPGAPGVLGFITPLSNRYCDTCSRFRLTSTGKLRPCLAFDVEVDIGAAIRAGDDDAVRAGFLRAAADKPEGHHWNAGQVTRTGMSELGG